MLLVFFTRNEDLMLHELDWYEHLLVLVTRILRFMKDCVLPWLEINGPINRSLIRSFKLFCL
jgi:hypothetical protein